MTLFDLGLPRNFLLHTTYTPSTFEVDLSNFLRGDTFSIKYIWVKVTRNIAQYSTLYII